MEPTNWASEHSDALRELLAQNLSFSETAAAINARFKTNYTRNAALGRAKRMELAGPDRPKLPPSTQSAQLSRLREIHSAKSSPTEFHWPPPVFERTQTAELRCVEIEPRHLSLIELAHGDCRHPYGGDEEVEPITFCGHPRRPGSSYCTPHFHLSRGPGTPSERTAHIVSLRVIESA